MKQQYDNTNSGALFPTPDKAILSGPFQFNEKEPKHVAVLELGDKEHMLSVYERGKDGAPKGKPVATGSVVRSATNGAENAAGNKTPVARGVIGGKKVGEIRLCVWKQANTKQGGDFYQLKPDSFEPRELPPL